MSEAGRERAQAARLPEGDVIAILLEQHARIRELFAKVRAAAGEPKQQAFDELRALLAVHETAEEMILRPVSQKTAGAEVADARNREEDEATHTLADLEKMNVGSAEFDTRFAEFERAVLNHAELEEREEFPPVRSGSTAEELSRMGEKLLKAEKGAPTHPHPMAAGSPKAQWALGPFASMVDKVRDAVKSSSSGT